MKGEKRLQLIRDTIEQVRLVEILSRPMSYETIDIVTGMPDYPALIAVPFDPAELYRSKHVRIDLPALGFRLVRIEP